MIGLFWNVRGLNHVGKKQCLVDIIKECKADFVGFMETKKEQFSAFYLQSLVPGKNFVWHFIPATGTAGGILLGLNSELFEVVGYIDRKYTLFATVINKYDGFAWHLVIVYGTAYSEFKLEFLAELHDVMENASLPICVGGDFNFVRDSSDKSNGNINQHLALLFNGWINKWGLLEIEISNRNFTWSNNQDVPVLTTIDRIFCSIC